MGRAAPAAAVALVPEGSAEWRQPSSSPCGLWPRSYSARSPAPSLPWPWPHAPGRRAGREAAHVRCLRPVRLRGAPPGAMQFARGLYIYHTSIRRSIYVPSGYIKPFICLGTFPSAADPLSFFESVSFAPRPPDLCGCPCMAATAWLPLHGCQLPLHGMAGRACVAVCRMPGTSAASLLSRYPRSLPPPPCQRHRWVIDDSSSPPALMGQRLLPGPLEWSPRVRSVVLARSA